MSALQKALIMVEREGQAVLVTVVEAVGSSPRDAGAWMVVQADGAFAGTIGGGQLEWQALAQAQALLHKPDGAASIQMDFALGPHLGQCCGGRVALAFERLGPDDQSWLQAAIQAEAMQGSAVTIGARKPDGRVARQLATEMERAQLALGSQRMILPGGQVLERFGVAPWPLMLFGAGHVARALVLALAPLPFQVRWIETRAGAFPGHVPSNVSCILTETPVAELAVAPSRAMVLAVTHSHALDLEIVQSALRLDRFALVGVIGSATKRARFASQLRAAGFSEDRVAKLVCPIGIAGIAGKEPAIIAASIAAQMLRVRDQELAGNAIGDACGSQQNPPSMQHGRNRSP